MLESTATSHAIGIETLRERQANGTIDEFWNVLTDKYFSGEFIPGSRRVPLDTVGRVAASMPRVRSIVVYCANHACPQSHAAAEKLRALGFTNVLVFEGGLEEWESAGLTLINRETLANA